MALVDISCSPTAMGLSDVSKWYNLVMVSATASAVSLGNKMLYPNFVRVIGSMTGWVPAMIALCELYGFTRVGMVSEYEEAFAATASLFQKEFRGKGYQITVAKSMNEGNDATDIIDAFRRSETRIINIQGAAATLRSVLCAAFRGGMYGPEFGWIVPGHLAVNWWIPIPAKDTHDCTAEELTLAASGYFATEFIGAAEDVPGEVTISGRKPSEIVAEYESKKFMPYGIIEYGYFAYDAVMATAVALDELLRNQGHTPDSLENDVTRKASDMMSALTKISFKGVGGNIAFDSKTGNRRGQGVKIENMQLGKEVVVGTLIDGKMRITKPIMWWHDMNNESTFENKTWVPPRSSPIAASSLVETVDPSVGNTLGGDRLVMTGKHFKFLPTVSLVTIGGKVCTHPVVASPTELSCTSPAGVGGPLPVVVSSAGAPGVPAAAFSYMLPIVLQVSRRWVVYGSRLEVVGKNFVNNGLMQCRMGRFSADVDTPVSTAKFVDANHIICDALSALTKVDYKFLFVSNDGGKRWASGLITLQKPVRWHGGSKYTPGQEPVPAITLYKNAVVLATLPSKADAPELVAAFRAAEAAVNADELIPGCNIRVEIVETGIDRANTVALLKSKMLANPSILGIAGSLYSSTTLGIAVNISTPLRVPTVIYGARSSVFQDSQRFPFVAQLSPSNVHVARAIVGLVKSFKGPQSAFIPGAPALDKGIAILTDTDAYCLDLGLQVKTFAVACPVYAVVASLPSTATAADIKEAAARMRIHTDRILESGVGIIFVEALGAATFEALLVALDASGCLKDGFRVVTSSASLDTKLPSSSHLIHGIVAVDIGLAETCQSKWFCPPDVASLINRYAIGPNDIGAAFDAVYTLVSALAPVFATDGGAAFSDIQTGARTKTMDSMRTQTSMQSISGSIAATGRITFKAGTNVRELGGFSYPILNVRKSGVRSTMEIVGVGSVKQSRSGVAITAAFVAERSFVFPRAIEDRIEAPRFITVGWIHDAIPDNQEMLKQAHEHSQQSALHLVGLINNNTNYLADTKLLLDVVPISVAGKSRTAKRSSYLAASQAMIKRATESSSSLVAFLEEDSDRAMDLMSVHTDTLVIGHRATSAALRDSIAFPNFLRTCVSDSQLASVTIKLMDQFEWTTAIVISDSASRVGGSSTLMDTFAAEAQNSTKNVGKVAVDDFTKMALLDAAMQNEVREQGVDATFKLFVVLTSNPQSLLAVVESVRRLGYLSSAFQFIVYSTAMLQSAFDALPASSPARASLDGIISIVPDGEALGQEQPLGASNWDNVVESAWARQVKQENNTNRFLNDALYLVARGANNCVDQGENLVASRIVGHLRRNTYMGMSGPLAIAPNTNDRVTAIGKVVISRLTMGEGGGGSMQLMAMDHVATMSADSPNIRVCMMPRLGLNCEHVVYGVKYVHAWGTKTSIKVRWPPVEMPATGSLHSGYRVMLMFDGEISSQFTVSPSVLTTEFSLEKGECTLNVVYSVAVVALYDNGKVESERETCRGEDPLTCRSGLPCIPDESRTGGDVNRVCGCPTGTFHSVGLPGAIPLYWKCEACLPGLRCNGGSAASLYSASGFFLSGNDTRNTAKRPIASGSDSLDFKVMPYLWKCPVGHSCVGNVSVATFLMSGTKEAREQQCATGHAGMLCQSCAEGFVPSGVQCSKCQVSQVQASVALLAIVIGALVVVALVVAVARRAGGPPWVERHFVKQFRKVESTEGAGGYTKAFYGIFAVKEGDCVTKDKFMAGLSRLVGNSKKHHKSKLGLWKKLDVDNDGNVTANEFLSFFYQLEKGRISTNKCRKRISRFKGYFDSGRVKAIKIVLITHFQLISSVPRAFPQFQEAEAVMLNRLNNVSLAGADPSLHGLGGSVSGILGAARNLLEPALDVIGNINLNALQIWSCAMGPRHITKMVLLTGTIIVVVGLLAVLPTCLRACVRFQNKQNHRKQNDHNHDDHASPRKDCCRITHRQISQASMWSTRLVIGITFLTYPFITTSVLRTFVCTDFADPSGDARQWLADDTFVQCSLNADGMALGEGFNSSYWFGFIYASVMVGVLVIGLPLFVLRTVWVMRFPYNKMHIPNEDGHLVASEAGKDTVGSLATVMKPSFWYSIVVDMIIKLVLTSGLGTYFARSQNAGVAMAAIVCALGALYYVAAQPYVHTRANVLGGISYISLASVYLSSIARSADYEMDATFGMVVSFLYFLPFAVGFLDLLQLSKFRCWQRPICSKFARCLEHRHVCGMSTMKRLESGKHLKSNAFTRKQANDLPFFDKHREMVLHMQRTKCLVSLFNGILKRTQQIEKRVHGNSGQKCWKHLPGGEEAEAAAKEMVQKIEALFKQIAEQPMALTWKCLAGAEHSAKKLSKLVFPEVDGTIQSRHNTLHLSFEARGVLMKTKVTTCLQVQLGRRFPVPPMRVIQVWHNTIVALLKPGVDMGSFKLFAQASTRREDLLSGGGPGSKGGDSRSPYALVPPVATADELEGYENAFKIFDADGSGLLDVEEFREVLRSLGVNPSPDEMVQLLKKADKDGDGEIDLAEFQKVMAIAEGKRAPDGCVATLQLSKRRIGEAEIDFQDHSSSEMTDAKMVDVGDGEDYERYSRDQIVPLRMLALGGARAMSNHMDWVEQSESVFDNADFNWDDNQGSDIDSDEY